MRTVDAKAIVAHLDRILREVQAGASFLITDGGTVLAELRPPGASTESPTQLAIGRLAADGALRLAGWTADPYPPSPITSLDGTALVLLDEERRNR